MNSRRLLTCELIFLIILSSIHLILNVKHHVRYLHNHDKHHHFASHHKNSLNYLINPDASSYHHYKIGLKNINQAHFHRNKLNSKHYDQILSEPSYLTINKKSALFSKKFIKPSSTILSNSLSEQLSTTANSTSLSENGLIVSKSSVEKHNPSNSFYSLRLNDDLVENSTIYSTAFESTIQKASTLNHKNPNSKRFAYTSMMLNDEEKNEKTQCKVSTTKRQCANCDNGRNESTKKLIKIAVLAPSDDTLPYSLNKILPSILHAVRMIEDHNGTIVPNNSQKINIQPISFEHLTSKYQFRIYYRGTNCSSSIGPLAAFDFFIEGSVDVFFGPLCGKYQYFNYL